jgi:HSP20 family protein
MAEAATKLTVKSDEKSVQSSTAPTFWSSFDNLRHEIERVFEDFDGRHWRSPFRRTMFDVEPFWRREFSALGAPAADIVAKDGHYEVAVELPGIDESNVSVSISDDVLTIKGEKKEEKEEKKKDYYLSERRFGSFERSFRVPHGVDQSKIEASFKKGVLTVTLPKTPEAQKKETKIAIKAA